MSTGYSPIFPLHFSPDGGYALNNNIVQVVKQNFKNLLLTVPGERIFDSNFGVGIKKYLFELKIEETFEDIKNNIYEQVQTYLPYLKIQNISITPSKDYENTIFISIQYIITNISTIDSINLEVSS